MREVFLICGFLCLGALFFTLFFVTWSAATILREQPRFSGEWPEDIIEKLVEKFQDEDNPPFTVKIARKILILRAALGISALVFILGYGFVGE